MAQTLAVYHYGYHTLKNKLVQYHEPTREPSDAEAVLEWELNTPFTSQDKTTPGHWHGCDIEWSALPEKV